MAEMLKDVAALLGLAAMIVTIGAQVWVAFKARPEPDDIAMDVGDDGFDDVCAQLTPAHRPSHAKRRATLPACRRRRTGR
jgi:hypothetical protein